jgi:predicted hotdog family 3-hydroxylacyl-ACP dehydratase
MSRGPEFPIAKVLPHAAPLLLLDELLDHGPEHVSCGVTIRPDSLFCDGANGVPSWVGLEYMAQTASAYSGVEEARQGKRPSVGLLLGTRRYETDVAVFPIGSTLRIVAKLALRDDNDLAAFDCILYCDRGDVATPWARGDVKAYRPKDLMAVVRGERI